MQGEVAEEVMRKEEPAITVYSVEDDGGGGDGHYEYGQSAAVHAVIKELEGFQETMEKKERIHMRDAGEEEECCN